MAANIKILELSRQMTILGLALTSLIITPSISFEPFNSPKFLISTNLAVVLLFLLLTSINVKSYIRVNPKLLILSVAFIIQAVITLFNHKNGTINQLFGVDGRNTGFILYVSLLIILMSVSILTNPKFIKSLAITLILVGLLSSFYGLIQLIGLDPINWNNQFNRVIGFFGNPNFQSAFMGITGAAVFGIIFGGKLSLTHRFILIALLMLLTVVIIFSQSQQGVLILISGFFVSSYIAISKISRYSKASKYYGFSILLIMVFIGLDILQKSPWGSLLYKQSVSNRGDLWRAAWRMAKDNPISGVGFDGYDNYYRAYRDEVAITSRGVSTTSNSSHNVLLDLLSSGGFVLLAIYIGVLILVFISAIKVIRRENNYNPYFTSIFAAWVAYQFQSLISINQIGLAIWGWALSGAIIGYERWSSGATEAVMLESSKWPFLNFIKIAIGLVAGFSIGVIPMRADVAFRSALDSRQIELVLASGYQWPQSPQRMLQVANLFKQNSLFDLSAQVAREATIKFPRYYENWELLSTLEGVSVEEKQNALSKMRALDPLNPDLK